MSSRRSLLVEGMLVLAFCCLACGRADAQVRAESFERLTETLPTGTLVEVRDDSGRRTKGRVTALKASGMTLALDDVSSGSRDVDVHRIVTVARVDSKKEGILLGFVAGATPGVILGVGLNTYCYNESPRHCPGVIFALGGLLGGMGAWIGRSIDGAINRDIIFRQPAGTSGLGIHLAPLVSTRGTGLLVSAAF